MILMRYSLQIKQLLQLRLQPPLTVGLRTTSGATRIPGPSSPSAAGSRAPCAAGTALQRRCRSRPLEGYPRGLGQGSNAMQPTWPKWLTVQPVDNCGTEVVERFNFSELPYKFPTRAHCQLPTIKVLTTSSSCLPPTNF